MEKARKVLLPEDALVQLMFRFSLLMEYQLMDLQGAVREFVERMSDALQLMDKQVTEEGKNAQALFETLFNAQAAEAAVLNSRAAARADDIFSEAQSEEGILPAAEEPAPAFVPAGADEDTSHEFKAHDQVWSKVAKSFESVCRLDERLKPQVFTLIQCMNFEDIQTQRLDHALSSYKLLNAGVMKFLKSGIAATTPEEVREFALNMLSETFKMYTMADERQIFEQVFPAGEPFPE
jgi:hypothetical protein